MSQTAKNGGQKTANGKNGEKGELVSPYTEDSGVQMSTPTDSQPGSPVANGGSEPSGRRWRALVTMLVLCLVNTLNYMDRYTLPAVLGDVMRHFSIDFAQTGLLQTVFVCSYMVVSPVFGYLGDHHNRVYIIGAGVAFWSVVTLASSFVPGEYFVLFVLTRALVGVGEASYVTVAPSLIGDLFGGESRSTAIAVFSLTTPLGSGLGYVVGGFVANLTGSWQWALRVTPVVGVACVVAAYTILQEPQRGAAERNAARNRSRTSSALRHQPVEDISVAGAAPGELEPLDVIEPDSESDAASAVAATEVKVAKRRNVFSAWLSDVAYLLRIVTYVLVVLGFTSVCFVAGSVSWFGPSFAQQAFIVQAAENNEEPPSEAFVSFLFGLVTCVSGVLGVIVGITCAKFLRRRRQLDRRADALVCGFGMLLASPGLFAALVVPRHSFTATWFVMMLALVALFVTWPLVTDMMLYVVEPRRRASASGLEMLATHLFGDASSPYILGALADLLTVHFSAMYMPSALNSTMHVQNVSATDAPMWTTSVGLLNQSSTYATLNGTSIYANVARFQALQYSLMLNTVVALLGCIAFFSACFFILPDHKRLLARLERRNSQSA